MKKTLDHLFITVRVSIAIRIIIARLIGKGHAITPIIHYSTKGKSARAKLNGSQCRQVYSSFSLGRCTLKSNAATVLERLFSK